MAAEHEQVAEKPVEKPVEKAAEVKLETTQFKFKPPEAPSFSSCYKGTDSDVHEIVSRPATLVETVAAGLVFLLTSFYLNWNPKKHTPTASPDEVQATPTGMHCHQTCTPDGPPKPMMLNCAFKVCRILASDEALSGTAKTVSALL